MRGENLVLWNGRIHGHPSATSVVVRDGRIVEIGSGDGVSEGAKPVDLQGCNVLPGFIDAHIHLFHTGLNEIGWRIDLTGATRDETLSRLAAAADARGAGEWIVGSGWDESPWPDPIYLDRTELDRVAPSAPMVAVRMDGHLLVANTQALKRMTETIGRDFDPWIDPRTGQVREAAAWALLESIRPDRATLTEALSAAAQLCHLRGVTSVHTMSRPEDLPTLARQRGRDQLRISVSPSIRGLADLRAVGLRSGFGDEWLRFGGVKIFADGSIGAKNAAVGVSYLGSEADALGELNHSADALEAMIREANEAGWQTVIHAIGDRAIDAVIVAHGRAQSCAELRHRIEHFELATSQQIQQARDLGLSVCMQPNFVGNWSGPGSMYERSLGPDRDAASNPYRRILDEGLPLAFGSDGMPVSPLYGIASAIGAPFPGQKICLEEAIDAYTQAGARLSFEEAEKGRLEVGMLADFVVLNGDLSVGHKGLEDCTVEMTLVGGATAYRSDEAA